MCEVKLGTLLCALYLGSPPSTGLSSQGGRWSRAQAGSALSSRTEFTSAWRGLWLL